MNVLVYKGPGVSQTSVVHTFNTLKTLLCPNYVVQTISPLSVATDPWEVNCALFVLPGGRDLPYVKSFEKSNSKISDFIRNGGAFLGICAGAYYACRRVEWEVGTDQEVSGDRPLRFFDGVGRGCTYPGFQYGTENGARAVALDVLDESLSRTDRVEGLYYNGGGEFVDVDLVPNCQSLASYTEGEAEGKCAAVLCNVGEGKAVLWAIHPEYPLNVKPALSAISNTRPDLQSAIEGLETRRGTLIRNTLRLLGLSMPTESLKRLYPRPQHLFYTPEMAEKVTNFKEEAAQMSKGSKPYVLEDYANVFHIYPAGTYTQKSASKGKGKETSGKAQNSPENARESSDFSEKDNKPVRIITLSKDSERLAVRQSLSFDITEYFTALGAYQKEKGLDQDREYRLGETLLYSEVVSSTQTLLNE